MNNKRRDILRDALGLLDRSTELVCRAKDEEQDALDSCPENLEGSDRYEKMEEAVEKLEEAEALMEDAKNCIMDAIV